MSHSPVLVVIPADRANDYEQAVDEAMAPYSMELTTKEEYKRYFAPDDAMFAEGMGPQIVKILGGQEGRYGCEPDGRVWVMSSENPQGEYTYYQIGYAFEQMKRHSPAHARSNSPVIRVGDIDWAHMPDRLDVVALVKKSGEWCTSHKRNTNWSQLNRDWTEYIKHLDEDDRLVLVDIQT
jgi:hypothetical protein